MEHSSEGLRTTKSESPVDIAMSRLHSVIDELSTLIPALDKKTESIRIPNPPSENLKEDGESPVECSLVTHIDDARSKVVSVNRRLNEMIDGIQL